MPKHTTSILLALALLLLGRSPGAQAAVDMFLKVAGATGESQDYAHPAEIDVLAWNWGLARPGYTNGVSVGDLSVTKWVDSASPALMTLCAQGTVCPTVTLTLRSTGDHPVGFYRLVLTKVVVASVAMEGCSGADNLTETVALNFAAAALTYTPLVSALSGTNYLFVWDVPANQGSNGVARLPDPRPVRGVPSTLLYTNGARTLPLTWASSAGEVYQVWAADNPYPPFQRYGTPIASAGAGTTTIILPADALKKFFRIETLPPQ